MGQGTRDSGTTGPQDNETTGQRTTRLVKRRHGEAENLRITLYALRITGLNFHGNEPEKFSDIAGSGAFNWQPRDNFGCGVHRPSQFDEAADARVLRALCGSGLSSDLV